MANISDPIMSTAAKLERIANVHIFSHIGLSSASIKIMCILDRMKITTPSGILEFLGGTRSNVSQRLDFLEKKGYVLRKHDSTSPDKRKVNIQLTTTGKKKLAEAEKWLKKANLYLEKYFTKKELEAHFAFFEKLNEILDRDYDNCPTCK